MNNNNNNNNNNLSKNYCRIVHVNNRLNSAKQENFKK